MILEIVIIILLIAIVIVGIANVYIVLNKDNLAGIQKECLK